MFREKNLSYLKVIVLAAALAVVPVLAFAVTPPPVAILQLGSLTIVSGDTNSNGYPENNQDIRFKVSLSNSAYSLDKAYAVTLALSTSNSNITIIDNSMSFGDIDVGASKSVTDDFGFRVLNNYAGAASFSIRIALKDSSGNSYSLPELIPISINIERPNTNPPVLAAIGNRSVNEGQALQFTLSATDPDGNPLTYSASGLPSGAAFNASTKVFSWTPNYTQAGAYSNITFTVSDGTLTDSETISITVNNVNAPPDLAVIGNKTVNENQLLTFVVSATDPDGGTLTYSASNLPSGASFNASTRTFSWTPTYTQSGSYPNIVFSVSDGSLTDSETISITVNNVNAPPDLAAIGNKTVNENQLLTFVISATDPDGTALTYSASNLPSGAVFNTSTRTLSWTRTYTQSGTYNITFNVSDGTLIDTETITITVNNVNRAPDLAVIGNKTVNENQLLTFVVSATDPDGGTLTYSASNLPAGAAFNASTRTFTWTPSYTQAGTYSNVTFTVSDGSLTDTEAISITVINVNRAPDLAAIGNKTVNENQLLTFVLSGTDPDGGTLTYSAANLPSGAAFNASTKTFSWTPTYYQAGTYSNITFSVSDGSLTDSEIISITVNNINGPPELAPIGNKAVDENQLLQFTLSAVDPDNDALTFSAANLPAGATFNATTRTFSWMPSYTQAGTYANIVFTVAAGAHTDSETITITVKNVDRPPDLAPIGAKTVLENSLLQFSISATDQDLDALTYSASGLPAGAVFDAATKTFRWTPTYEQAGVYNVTLSVSDGVLSDSETILITVANVIQPPKVISVTPSSGSSLAGTQVNFSALYYDSDGYQNISMIEIRFNNPSVTGAFYAYYNPVQNKLYLKSGDGTSWLGGYAPGTVATIKNGYGILDCSRSSVSLQGNNLTLNLSVTFKSAFKGSKYIYLRAKDSNKLTSGWVSKGTWRIN